MEDADVSEYVRIAYKNCGYCFKNWVDFILNKNPSNFYKILTSINIVRKYTKDEKYLKAILDLKKDILKECDEEIKDEIKLIKDKKIMRYLLNKRNY